MSMMDENGSHEIGSSKATSIEPDEGNETDEERLQYKPAMPIINENVCEGSLASKDSSSNTADRPILAVGSVYCLVAYMSQ